MTNLHFQGSFRLYSNIIKTFPDRDDGVKHYIEIEKLFEARQAEIKALPDSVVLHYQGAVRNGRVPPVVNWIELCLTSQYDEAVTEQQTLEIGYNNDNKFTKHPVDLKKFVNDAIDKAKEMALLFKAKSDPL